MFLYTQLSAPKDFTKFGLHKIFATENRKKRSAKYRSADYSTNH